MLGLVDRIQEERRRAGLAEHLERHYGVRVAGTSRLDQDVYHVDLAGAPDWVARVFPPARPREAVAGDAGILRRLEEAGFPAERCAVPEPVSDLDDEGTVLVTAFVEGERARDGRTYAYLGALLGRLHAATGAARPGALSRPGGAWHHVCPQGTLDDELDAATDLLSRLEQRLPPRDRARAVSLRRQLLDIDLRGLPEALLHPDFVPVNTIVTADDHRVLVDWAGAGRGPRIWSLGFLLYATGGSPRLIELVASRYARHVEVTEEELAALPDAILERPLVFAAWHAAHRERPFLQFAREIAEARRDARRIAAAAAPTLQIGPGTTDR
jgi:Ser/Thr protein kinase RdoA (MazF antagonist)